MTKAKRKTLIGQLAGTIPDQLGRGTTARRNFESLDDEALEALDSKVQTVRKHGNNVKASPKTLANIKKHRASLKAKRAQSYGKLKALSEPHKNKNATKKVRSVELQDDILKTLTPYISQKAAIETKNFLLKNLHYKDISTTSESRKSFIAYKAIYNYYSHKNANSSVALTNRLKKVLIQWLIGFKDLFFDSKDSIYYSKIINDQKFNADLDSYLDIAFDNIRKDTMRLMKIHMDRASHNIEYSHQLAKWLELDQNFSTIGYNSVFSTNSQGILAESEAIQGLAEMHTLACRFEPDIIVSLSGGGNIVGDFIAKQSQLHTKHLVIDSMSKRQFHVIDGNASFKENFSRILIVDDVIHNGEKLISVRNWIREMTIEHSPEIQTVALVGSVEAHEKVSDDVMVMKYSPDPIISLPWNRGGEYRMTREEHIFGDKSEDTFVVSRKQLSRISDELGN